MSDGPVVKNPVHPPIQNNGSIEENAEKNNVFDDLLDFETKMYQFLDHQNSDGADEQPPQNQESSNSSRYMIRDNRESVISNAKSGPTPSKWYCMECQRSFAAQFALDQHRRFKHQGYKIHCRYCAHTTTNGYAMFLHVRREHGDVDEEAAAAQRLAAAAQRGGQGETGRPGRLLTPRSTNRKAVNARRKRRAAASRYRQTAPVAPLKPGPKPQAAPLPPPPLVKPVAPKVENVKLENLVAADPLPPLLPDTPYNRRKRNAAAIKLGSVAALQCDRCDKKFAFHSGLRMHMKMVHSGFKFTCQYCGLNFTNGYAIHRHVNIVHNISGSVRNQNTLQPPSAQLQAMLAHAAPTMAPRRFLTDSLMTSATTTTPPVEKRHPDFLFTNNNTRKNETNELIINTNGFTNELMNNNGHKRALEDEDQQKSSRQRRKAPPSKKLLTSPMTSAIENEDFSKMNGTTTQADASLSNIMRRFGEYSNHHNFQNASSSPVDDAAQSSFSFRDAASPLLRNGSAAASPPASAGDDYASDAATPPANGGAAAVARTTAAECGNVLACPLCPYKTRGRETMRQHFYYHLPAQTQQEDRRNGLLNDYNMHRCPFCPFVCDQQTQLTAHAAAHFSGGGCVAAKRPTAAPESPTTTTLRHRPQLRAPAKFACVFCSRKFDDARTLNEHEARHTKMTTMANLSMQK